MNLPYTEVWFVKDHKEEHVATFKTLGNAREFAENYLHLHGVKDTTYVLKSFDHPA